MIKVLSWYRNNFETSKEASFLKSVLLKGSKESAELLRWGMINGLKGQEISFFVGFFNISWT